MWGERRLGVMGQERGVGAGGRPEVGGEEGHGG